MIEKIFEKPYATIEYDTDTHIAYLYLIGIIEIEEYKTAFDSILDFGIKINLKKLIVDQSKVEKSTMESRAWLLINWFPRVKKNLGETIKVGLLLSSSIFSKIGAEYVVNVVRNISKFDIRIFQSIQDAETWLKSLPSQE